jgi:hypothetical protein
MQERVCEQGEALGTSGKRWHRQITRRTGHACASSPVVSAPSRGPGHKQTQAAAPMFGRTQSETLSQQMPLDQQMSPAGMVGPSSDWSSDIIRTDERSVAATHQRHGDTLIDHAQECHGFVTCRSQRKRSGPSSDVKFTDFRDATLGMSFSPSKRTLYSLPC